MDSSPEAILRRLNDRDVEMGVLLQRADVLNRACSSSAKPPAEEFGSRDALKRRLTAIYRCQEQVETVLHEAVPLLQPPSSSPSNFSPDPYTHTNTKVLSSLLSKPSLPPPCTISPRAPGPAPNSWLRLHLKSSSSPPASAEQRDLGGVPVPVLRSNSSSTGGGGGGSRSSAVTYCVFLERLTRPESKGFVEAIKLFLFSILGNGGAANPAAGRPRSANNDDIRRETEEVEVYGSFFLPQRCAEFFLAMQNAMGVHPSWAKLGYENLVACREHLERFVMCKIHPLAFGSKLDGALDASISARLRALQFLSPQDLNVAEYARDDTVLALAQEELRKMGSGRCPGDIVTRVVRCCDTIFALLDQGRRLNQRDGDGDCGARKIWPPDLDLDPAGTADDFLPVLIYVVLRARVPRLHSMCEYVQAFHSPVALMSRPGYCFVALRSAVEFLMTLDGAAVGMSEKDFRRRALGTMTATNPSL